MRIAFNCLHPGSKRATLKRSPSINTLLSSGMVSNPYIVNQSHKKLAIPWRILPIAGQSTVRNRKPTSRQGPGPNGTASVRGKLGAAATVAQ
jgi:hypothetical protein